MIETLEAALSTSEFRIGLLGGVLGFVTAITMWRVRRRTLPFVGIIWVVAATVGLAITTGVSEGLLLGLSLVAAAGLTSRHVAYWLHFPLFVAGGWLVAHHSGLVDEGWVPWLVLGVIVVGSPLSAVSHRHLEPKGLAIVLWGVSVFGVYATVPDTEQALVLLGAVGPLMLLGLLNMGCFEAAGSYAAVALLAWATAVGGVGRPASIIGGLACLGIFLMAPLARRIRNRATESSVAVLLTHVPVVAIASRIAGLRTSVAEAALIAGVALLLGLVVLTVVGEARARRVTDPDSRAVSS